MGTSKKRGNGEGTIFKREVKGKTYWIAEYTIEMYDKNGKRKGYLQPDTLINYIKFQHNGLHPLFHR